MYSLVLVTLLGGADSMPAGHGCWGGNGCGGGYSCGGGYGGCNGCNGGGHGCRGGLFGRRHGCNGGCNGCNGGYARNGHGCSGCNGGVMSGCSGGTACNGGRPAMEQPPPVKDGAPPTAAIIDVSLPADAALFVNGQPTTSTTARRSLISPPLPTGRDYFYTLRADVVRDGQTLSTTRQVTVRPGQRHSVILEPQAEVASK